MSSRRTSMLFLEISHCQVTDAGWKAVAACKQLRSLDIYGCDKVTDTGRGGLHAATAVAAYTRHCQVTDGGLPFAEGAEGCGGNLPHARESIRVVSADCLFRTG